MASSGSHKISSYPLATGQDLDQIRTPGFYDVDDPVNGPGGVTGTLFMMIFGSHTGTPGNLRIKQLVFEALTGNMYQRTYNGVSFSTWGSQGGGAGSGANLTFSRTATTLTVLSDSGTDAVLPLATPSLAGLLSASDKTKLDATVTGFLGVYSDIATLRATVPTGTSGQYAILTNGVNTDPSWGVWDADNSPAAWRDVASLSAGPTNLTLTRDATTVTILSDTGTDATIPGVSSTNAGVLSAADKVKLDSVAAGAQVNPTGSALVTSINTQLANVYRWQGSPQSFNVLDYGADPTGANPTATREAFAAAIAALAATGRGGEIYAPSGLYRIASATTASAGGMILQSNMTLRGDGIGRTIIQCADLGNRDMSGLVRTASNVETINVMIRDLTLDGNKDGQTGWANTVPFFCGTTPGDRTRMCKDIWLINVEAKNGRNGRTGSAHVGGGGYGFDPHEVTDRIVFLNCIAHDNEEDGFVLDGCTNFTMSGCRSWNNGRHGYNFVTESHTGIVGDCASFSNGSNNFMIQTDSHHIQLDNCYSGFAGEQGIRIRAGATIQNTHCKISNCLVRSSGRNGISITGASYNTITTNKIIDSSQVGTNTYMELSFGEDDGDTGITFFSAQYNVVANNDARATATNRAKYAFREDTLEVSQPPKYNTYLWNVASGQVSGKYSAVDLTSDIHDSGFGDVYAASAFGVDAANADNGVALRTLVDFVSNSGGGTILLPAGVILASGTGAASQGVMALPDNVHVKGQGIDVTILRAINSVNAGYNGVIRTLSGQVGVGNVVSDMTIDAQPITGTGDVTGLNIAASSVNSFIGLNLKITAGKNGVGNAGYGVRTSASSTNAKFINVEASSNARDGFYIDASTGDNLTNCVANFNGRYGFNLHNCVDASVTSPYARGNTSYNIIVDGGLHSKISGGTVDGTGGGSTSGIRILGPGVQTAMYTTIYGMSVKNCQRSGLEIVGSDWNQISHCFFVDNGLATHNVYSDVLLDNDTSGSPVPSQFNKIDNCVMRTTATNRTRFGIRENATSLCDNNTFRNNLFAGHAVSSTFIQGASTRRFDVTFFDMADDIFAIAGSADRTKRARFEVDGLTTATTRVVTIPNKDGTMAMISDIVAGTTEYADNVFRVTANADATRKAAFDVSAVPTGTVRTFTVPNKNGTLALLDDLGVASPAGGTTQFQYNNAGVSAGSAGFTYDLTNLRPQAPNGLQIGNVVPASVPTGTLVLSSVARSNDIVRPAVTGSVGVLRRLQPNIGGRGIGFAMTRHTSSTTIDSMGFSPTALGTASGTTFSSATKIGTLKRIRYTSTAAANSSAGWATASSASYVTRGSAPGCGGYYVNLLFNIATRGTNARFFAGVCPTATVSIVDTALVTLVNCFGLASDSDTNLQWITNDNVGNITKTDLGSNFAMADGLLLEVEIYCAPNDTNMYYTVRNLNTDNTASGTLSANLPQNTIALCPQIALSTGADTAAVALDIVSVYLEADV